MAFQIKNIAKWIKILDDLGIDIGDFDIKKLAGLGSGSGLGDVLSMFDDSKQDVDGGLLEQFIGKEAGSLTDLLGNDDDDDDDNDNLVSTLLGAVDSDDTPNSGVGFGGLLGSVLGGGDDSDGGGILGSVLGSVLGGDDKDDDDDDSPLDSIIDSIF